MNLYELAEKDLATTIEDAKNGSGRTLVLIDEDGSETELVAIVGDIGYLLDSEGNPIAARSIVAAFRMSSFMKDGDYAVPSEGWRARTRDMAGKEWTLFVTRAEPDRTIGICRLILSFDFTKEDSGD